MMINKIEDIPAVIESVPELRGKVVYRAWREGHAPPLPWVCWLVRGSDNFAADGIAYHRISRVDIELYTESKDIALESALADALDAAGLYWDADETYIDDEQMYEKVFEVEV